MRIPIIDFAGTNDHLYLKPHAERGVRPPASPSGAELDVPLTRLRKWEGAAPKTARAHITNVEGDGTLCGHDFARTPPMLRIDSWAERADRQLCKVCAREWACSSTARGATVRVLPVGNLALAWPDAEGE